jgi:hypothetical protein
MRQRLKLVVLLVFLTARPADAQISSYAIKEGEFFGVNRQRPRQGQATMRFAF